LAKEHRRTCPFCEATCGVVLQVEGEDVMRVRGDKLDPFSQGYICAKAVALKDVHHDPDRLTHPLRRQAGGWQPVGWSEALDEAAQRLAEIQRRHGVDSVAVYQGNPVIHSYSTSLAAVALTKALGSHNLFSTASVDHQPHLVVAREMLGNKALLLVPDIDRADFLLLFGSNPVVSNGSMLTAPNLPARLAALRRRGGRLVVVDPQHTGTAALADLHLPIRPGLDALLLLAMLHTLFAENLVDLGVISGLADGLSAIADIVAPYAPERTATITEIEARVTRQLARDFAAARTAVCHGRLGISTQPFGTLCCWLIQLLNCLTGRVDVAGGAMLATPAVDLAGLARLLGETGSRGTWHSRVRGFPEVNGELPLAVLAEEIAHPGYGQIRGLVTIAGNPVLSAPGGERLERALTGLDFLVAVDFYLNETTRMADLILPGRSALERDHFDLIPHALAIRNVARYCPPLFKPQEEHPDDWEILLALAVRLAHARGRAALRPMLEAMIMRTLTPRRLLSALVRFGPHGKRLRPFGRGLTLGRLARAAHTVDLGPLRAGRLSQVLRRRIDLAPALLMDDVKRVEAELMRPPAPGDLVLAGRREARRNNSWLANALSLAKGPDACTLFMHPTDAAARGIQHGEVATISSAVGAVDIPVHVSEQIRRGVVSIPHGFGHGRDGTRLSIANRRPGVSVNGLTDEMRLDPLSGTAAFNGLFVQVERRAGSATARSADRVPIRHLSG
jgi:anaerobic selenocysteine-containing dehydrogenase